MHNKKLLINCDLAWVQHRKRFIQNLETMFDTVTTLDLNEPVSDHIFTGVTHWITNPAPRYKITEELVAQHLPDLRIMGSPSTGTSHISNELLASGSITIRCLRDIDATQLQKITSSSEHTFFLFLASVRKSKVVFGSDLEHWRDNMNEFRGRQISGMKALIFGHGRIGSNMARYLTAFGADVVVYEPDLAKHNPDFEFTTLEDIETHLSMVDVVFLCFHYDRQNKGFFSKSYLNAMRDDAYFVNTSRGENLDETELVRLIKGQVSGVALDVIANEQSVDFAIANEARQGKSVLLTPFSWCFR